MESSPLESVTQAKITKKLRALGYIVIRLRSTDQSGWPDLMVLKNGITFFIEVKRGKEVSTPLQAKKHDDLRRQGFRVEVWNENTLISEYLIEEHIKK